MRKVLTWSAVALLFFGSSGAAAYFYFDLGGRQNPEESGSLAETELELDPPIYHAMPALIVSANYEGRLRYLQVKLSIMSRSEETISRIEANTPLIQDALIMLLNEYPFSQLERPDGKEILRAAAEERVREIIEDEGVESVLFTGFVIQ